MKLSITTAGEMGRVRQEQYVRQAFADQFGAEIYHFLPYLLSIEDVEQNLQGVLGVHPAGEVALFLERYLDSPVEPLIAKITGEEVARSDVIELGNLATTSPGGGRMLIVILASFLRGAGYQWVTFTALPGLINSFRRFGIDLYTLAEADPGRLGEEARYWGSYYEGAPKVVAANVEEAHGRLECAAVAERLQLTLLWREAFLSGQRMEQAPLSC